MSETQPDECARAAFDPDRDEPDTFYGFTRAEWTAAGEVAGGSAAVIAGNWDLWQASLRAGGVPGVDIAAFVALGRLGASFARRAIARLEPAFSRDTAEIERATARGAVPDSAFVARLLPDPSAPGAHEEVTGLLDQLRVDLPLARELERLAKAGQ